MLVPFHLHGKVAVEDNLDRFVVGGLSVAGGSKQQAQPQLNDTLPYNNVRRAEDGAVPGLRGRRCVTERCGIGTRTLRLPRLLKKTRSFRHAWRGSVAGVEEAALTLHGRCGCVVGVQQHEVMTRRTGVGHVAEAERGSGVTRRGRGRECARELATSVLTVTEEVARFSRPPPST